MMNSKAIQKVKGLIRDILRGRRSGRRVRVFPDDIFIVSYPKSGNTWVRFLVANLLYPFQKITFANIEQIVPDIYQVPDRILNSLDRPRVLKSHEYFDPRYNKVIYIIRDPRDVILSYYYYHLKMRVIGESYPLDRYSEKFLQGELDPFGSWGENVGSWLGAREGDSGFLSIRYEDLRSDTDRGLTQIATFLGISASPTRISQVAANCSFDAMRSAERQHGAQWAPIKGGRSDIPFVRSGTPGQWKTKLPIEIRKKIEVKWKRLLIHTGYLN